MISRRNLLKFATALSLGGFVTGDCAFGSGSSSLETKPMFTNDLYPTQPPELVREVVTVSHFNFDRVKQLVDAQPSLANAAWDWGFGDWETCLGAASHMGNRQIAEYLISKGARPSIFSAAMLGQLDVVKAFVQAHHGVQSIAGPHSISLLAHARAGGERALPVLHYLEQLGGAGAQPQLPLEPSQVDRIVGSYSFGFGSNQTVRVAFEQDHVTWTRVGTMTHTLFHLGDLKFYPAGAKDVRVEFQTEPDVTMTVLDPTPVFTAKRTATK